MSETAYSQLSESIANGNLEIYHVIAPPRNSSTAVERALSNSPDIHAQINDPWCIYDTDREAQTYDYILRRFQDAQTQTRTNPIRIVIKDIADYIPPGDAWQRMTSIVRHTIFLIREPLLATESLMRIMAKEVPRDRGNAFAKRSGFASWQAMQNAVTEARDYRPYEELYQGLFRNEQPISDLPEMQLPVLATTPLSMFGQLGFATADKYASSKCYATWHDLIRDVTDYPDKLAGCQDLLDINFACRITGWTALSQHYAAMQPSDNFTVVDATMFRAAPEVMSQVVLRRADLKFASSVVNWSHSSKTFTSDYDGDIPYYDKVIQSIGIAPPTETTVPTDRFPAFIRASLEGEDGAFAIYRRYLKLAVEITPSETTAQILAATFDGKSLRDIDPVFYKELFALIAQER